jgi:hypothetical protein
MKTFYLKILTIIAILIGIYLSITYYIGYTRKKNFQIINERQSMIIQLPNAEYIEIASKNDHVTDYDTVLERPFSIINKIQKNSNVENSIVRTNMYNEYVEYQEDFKRIVNITPVSSRELEVEIEAYTAYLYKENLKYNIQLDYSNKTVFREEDGYVFFVDKGCRVEIHDPLLDYTITDNKQTIVLSRVYDLEVNYNFSIVISCKE